MSADTTSKPDKKEVCTPRVHFSFGRPAPPALVVCTRPDLRSLSNKSVHLHLRPVYTRRSSSPITPRLRPLLYPCRSTLASTLFVLISIVCGRLSTRLTSSSSLSWSLKLDARIGASGGLGEVSRGRRRGPGTKDDLLIELARRGPTLSPLTLFRVSLWWRMLETPRKPPAFL